MAKKKTLFISTKMNCVFTIHSHFFLPFFYFLIFFSSFSCCFFTLSISFSGFWKLWLYIFICANMGLKLKLTLRVSFFWWTLNSLFVNSFIHFVFILFNSSNLIIFVKLASSYYSSLDICFNSSNLIQFYISQNNSNLVICFNLFF